MSNPRAIKTNNVYPPIPIRDYDWCAWYEDDGEEVGRYGWGSCEQSAIVDLETRYGECE